MTSTTALLLLAAGWLIVGLATGLTMGRRGHSPVSWAIIGTVLGPLAIPVAIASSRSPATTSPQQLARGRGGAGPVNVLIGVDGSPGSRAAARAAVDLLGDRLGGVTLASVVDYDTARQEPEPDERSQALAYLEEAQEHLSSEHGIRAATVLLAGKPAESLLEHAAEKGFGLLAVGRRGKGAARLVLGSVASTLARDAAVPVLIAPGDA